MSYSNRPRPRWFAPSSIPPILLLTFVTSFAFNHALITTQRKQDASQYRIRTALLQDTIDYNSRLLYQLNPPSSSRSWHLWPQRIRKSVEELEPEWVKEDRESLVRRWRAIGLDPFHQGLIAPDSNLRAEVGLEVGSEGGKEESMRAVGPREVTWGEIFLGSKEKRSSLTERWQKVTRGIKESFSQLNPQSSPSPTADTSTTKQEEKELEELSRLWASASKES